MILFSDGMEPDFSILDREDLGYFDEGAKIRFLQAKIVQRRQPEIVKFERLLARLELALSRKKEVDEAKKWTILSDATIVGMTVSGAAIHRSLLRKLAPRVVIVEEAAEILEPSIIACIGPKTDRLVMIGDHKQLRPGVETFELRKRSNFDVSMMERLINCGFPFKALKKQNRLETGFTSCGVCISVF